MSPALFHRLLHTIVQADATVLDKYVHVLSDAAVHMMPIMNVTSAKRCQGHQSFWRATRASGIVKETF